MRSSLTAPALTAWVVAGMLICFGFGTPWYVGVFGGLVAAAAVYWVWATVKPTFDLAPNWGWYFFMSAAFAAVAAIWLGSKPITSPLVWINGLLALGHFARGVEAYLRRHEPRED